MTKSCATCGFENLDDAIYCESCGAKITGLVSPPVVPTPGPSPQQPPAGPTTPPQSVEPTPTAPKTKVKCSLCGTENDSTAPFCDNCGAKLSGVAAAPAGPSAPISKLILPQGDEISIMSYPRTFGRSDFLRFDKSDYISRKHFEISMENGKYFILDLGSTNGTNLNGAELTGKTELKSGDSIELAGVITLTFQTT